MEFSFLSSNFPPINFQWRSMKHSAYSYTQIEQTKYTFISSGKKVIPKVVLFTPTAHKDLLNLAFGDLMVDGTIDNRKESNNGDMGIVLATVIQIVIAFIMQHPHYTVFFRGSTEQRMVVYERILRAYYQEFKKEFIITGLVWYKDSYQEMLFDAKADERYFAFLIRRNI